MTPKKLNAAFLDIVKKEVPEGTNLANLLMDTLSIGKEAIYRRFRGEVPFTLSEAILIAKKLDISLDQLAGTSARSHCFLDLYLSQLQDPIDTYYSILEYYIQLFSQIERDSDYEIWDASNQIPLIFYMRYNNLQKLYLLKWLYNRNMTCSYPEDSYFKELIFPEKIINKQKELIHLLSRLSNISMIWDMNVFNSLANDIHYFHKIDMISGEDIQEIKKELFSFLRETEKSVALGKTIEGVDLNLYISSIQFDSSYLYIESPKQSIGLVKVYDLDMITSAGQQVVERLKSWVQSLKKFSTLISQSAELQRHDFFKQQRDLFHNL